MQYEIEYSFPGKISIEAENLDEAVEKFTQIDNKILFDNLDLEVIEEVIYFSVKEK
jgi:nicotinate-nucleotide pyrophosphorylase